MSKLSRAALKSENNANITTNGNREISGSKHNSINEDMIDSFPTFEDNNSFLGLFPYDSTRNYTVGQGVLYSGVLYRCTTNTTGAWNASHWTAVTTAAKDEISFTPASIGTVMTLISGYKYQRTHGLDTQTPKIIVRRPDGSFFDLKDLGIKVIDSDTVQFDFGWGIDSGTTYIMIEK